ncbi:probable RNA helicase armi [Uranotaenia lowii]|uniref:probable RNA helicase armi n=1 Tax=Uranotaenia lowii TaxID=190385 RepID=UPI002478EC89|nr:probable RNA helicase armi [Uranotaenia lowii]XP_055602252.1 probable RNA helicase armi [Uranotaenia lowii]XP_055602253.1 probable RNA helicase armi [Uranotaenia lowii]XP_055602254.1 probable RNA helicase armi [Uranotaenia lowii]XP_055602256.1 probable RNA helicase armi [Uranotaenia lowii]XP_055602257.1 probable RNA helicase armi [Uranotaenia lowii]
MFRLVGKMMYGLVTTISGSKETDEDKIKRLQAQLDDDDEVDDGREAKRLEDELQTETVKPTNCFQTTGYVTRVEANYIIIDNTMCVDKKVLQACSFHHQLEEGVKISFLAYKTSDDDHPKIVKLEEILGEIWGDEKPNSVKAKEEDTQTLAGISPTYFSSTQRSEQGTVIAKRLGLLTVETDQGEHSIEMDNVKLTFIPEMGDFVVLDCVVQNDEKYFDMRGSILEVRGITPTQIVRGTGLVTKADSEGGEIKTDDGVFLFLADACETAQIPGPGDRVAFEAVENAKLTYRCIKVLTEKAAPRQLENKADDFKSKYDVDFFEDKRGIKITDNLEVKLNNLKEKLKVEVTIKNTAEQQHKILRSTFMSNKQTSQLRLLIPKSTNESYILKAGDSIIYSFEITANNFGISKEVFMWSFGGGFKIARCFTIKVGDDETLNVAINNEGTSVARSAAGRQKLAAWNVYKSGGEVTPGQRISKTANFIDIKIGGYHVPDDLKQILLNPASNRNLIDEELDQTQRCLQKSLCPENYKPLLKTFLWMEDVQCEVSITRFNMDRAHFTREDNYMALRIENIGESRPSLIPGDKLIATTPWINPGETGNGAFVHKVMKHRILVKFSEHFHEKYNGEDYKIIFQPTRGAFQKQHHAINCVTSAMGMDYLFPSKTVLREPWMDLKINNNGNLVTTDFDNEFPWYNPNLNEIQKDAVKNILRSEARPLPYVIFGPPGTGKTMTIIELIHQIVRMSPGSRIMVGTPSNSSANLITERLIDSKVLKPGEFIRIVGLNYIEQELVPEHLAPYCGTVDIASERTVKGEVIITESGLMHRLQLKHLGRHRITIGTCVTLGTLMHFRFPRNHFTHVIIDEAGQCLETETLIPMTFISKNCGTVVLAGDPMQLGPVVMSSHAADRGFGTSMLVRLMESTLYKADKTRFPRTGGYNPRLVTKLRYNYRSLPCILNLYSELFYENSLIARVHPQGSTEAEFLASISDILQEPSDQNATNGFIFWGVNGVNKQTPESPSWFNPSEAKSVFNFLLKLYKKQVRPEQIGIITPYQQQAKTIRRILDEGNLLKPKIGSVEEFQGQERMVILISTVRTSKSQLLSDQQHALGFVASPKRLNVAISRARALLVIFGSPHLLSADKQWQKLLLKAISNNSYRGCDLPEHLVQERVIDEKDFDD